MTIIKTKEFILRSLKIEDAEGYFECHQDSEAKKNFMPYHYPHSLIEAKKKTAERIVEMKKKKPNSENFAIIVNDEFAGYVFLHDLNIKHHEFKAGVGMCINKKFRGRGIGSKSLKLVTDYAFKKYKKLVRIEGQCRSYNIGSARAMEKAGFQYEGTLRKVKFKDGKYIDDKIFSRVR